MPLPQNLSGIFDQKQKSYKMLLMLSMLDEMGETPREISLSRVVEHFKNYLIEREHKQLIVDEPPVSIGKSWQQASTSQILTVLNNPINALGNIIYVDKSRDRIRFRTEVEKQVSSSTLVSLRKEANRELENYYDKIQTPNVSIKILFDQLMNHYLSAKAQPFSGHPLGNLVRHTFPDEIKKLPFITDRYKVQGSVGQGNWANIPWLAIMDKSITETTQQGEYIVYLFSEDMQSVYLTFNQGVTIPLKQGKREGYELLKHRVQELRDLLPFDLMTKDDQINLTSSGIGSDYQVSTVAYIRYDRDNLPDDEILKSDLRNLIKDYTFYVKHKMKKLEGQEDMDQHSLNQEFNIMPVEWLSRIKAFIEESGFYFPSGLIENFYLSLKTKPFMILAGISGTGKTKLVELFAEAVGATEENGRFTLIPVRPDWSDPTDLLGYRDLTGVFKPGKLTRVFWEASQLSQKDKPYFVCLDEMNLARVEHYFSDILSVMETRRWKVGEIITDALLEEDEIRVLIEKQDANCMDSEGEGGDDPSVLQIPENVYIIGTVNMDETTQPFSKKVLDRAQTIEFNEIDLNHFPKVEVKSLNEPERDLNNLVVPNSFLKSNYLLLKDVYLGNEALVERTTKRLMEVNKILEAVHSNVGFRVRDTICFYMVNNERFELLPEDEAFDLQLLQKILPRLQGSHASIKRALLQLMAFAIDQRLNLEEFMEDASPLYLGFQQGQQVAPSARFPQSARKIAFMLRRLEEDGFTSFWIA
ncbi:MrcB family domain-containing protein [Desulfitobacterium sp. Sab5]|uniref:MrcB family domain-containing protein n=1 Tax=Desulfitobacterium nosdiversum TaxID=3375356 RepID=UPI003CF5A068